MIKERDLLDEVEFEIDKDAFKGPFICCNLKTGKIEMKKDCERWKCSKCQKEFVGSKG